MAGLPHIDALLDAVNDVRWPDSGPPVRHLAGGTPEHHSRFGRFVGELRIAKSEAEDWWARLIDVETQRTGDRRNAQINVKTRRRNGPVVHPTVIRCVRAAWLDCEQFNRLCAPAARVAPEAFVLLWLIQSGETQLAQFLGCLPFWPLGIDASGAWV